MTSTQFVAFTATSVAVDSYLSVAMALFFVCFSCDKSASSAIVLSYMFHTRHALRRTSCRYIAPPFGARRLCLCSGALKGQWGAEYVGLDTTRSSGCMADVIPPARSLTQPLLYFCLFLPIFLPTPLRPVLPSLSDCRCFLFIFRGG